MNADIKRKWVEALRSGEYKQGRQQLRTASDEFCCLGVLCDVVGVRWVQDAKLRGYMAETDDDESGLWLPDGLGLGIENLDIEEGILAKMNDGGASFSEISDYIEAHI